MAPRRRRVGAGALRPVPTPLRRGAAVVAVTGSALSLSGGASPEPEPLPPTDPGPAVVPVAQAQPVQDDSIVLKPAMEPVDPDPDIADAAELVKAVQLAEQEVARQAAERAEQERAAQERAAQERAAQERAAQERAAQERAAAEARAAAASARADCATDVSGLGEVKSHVGTAAGQLGCRFGEPDMHGVAGRAGTSDHPSGHAIDFMVARSTGDALASCALESMDALGIKYVIWEQRINHGNGWERMEDRGGDTANHFDHVHISFDRNGGGGSVQGC